MRDGDLDVFLKHFKAAQKKGLLGRPVAPDQALRTCDNGLFASEIWRLSRSLQIAAILGDAEPEAAIAADAIAGAVRDVRCAPLDNTEAWEEAIAWALSQNAGADTASIQSQWYERQQQVGLACARLRAKGYAVKVGAYGPEVLEKSRVAIAQRIDELVGLVGGTETITQVCRILKDSNLFYDGMWLFGDRVPGVHQSTSPAVPYGWLLSLGLRRAGRKGTARKPEVAWRTLITLAIDLAASYDCQRYGQYEQFNIPPTEYYRALSESLVWRELFSFPQTPPRVLLYLKKALAEIVSQVDEAQLGLRLRDLFREIEAALNRSADDKPSVHPRDQAKREFPLLFQLAWGARGVVNASYLGPLEGHNRNHDRFIFFEISRSEVVTLPRALMTAAACDVIFRLIWEKLERNRAAWIVGATMEKAIECACEGKAATIIAHRSYKVDKQVYEIDVATRENDRIVLFESKAKSLTAKSRSGDMMAFFSDYTDSYLAILEQLVRHEVHLRQGLTPLTRNDEKSTIFGQLKSPFLHYRTDPLAISRWQPVCCNRLSTPSSCRCRTSRQQIK